MPLDRDPVATFSYVVEAVERRGLAYVCLTQPRTDMILAEGEKWGVLNSAAEDGKMKVRKGDISLTRFAGVLEKTPVFASGNYDGENCFDEVESGELDGITFARWFISNPDLVEKLRNGWTLTPYKVNTVYSDGPEGYTDYPVSNSKET